MPLLLFQYYAVVILLNFSGCYSEEETPVPIPNTEVKGLSGNGTTASGRGRVARCQDFLYHEGLSAFAEGPSSLADSGADGQSLPELRYS